MLIEEKLKEFGTEGEAFKKRSEDMRQLTVSMEKTKNKESLTKTELEFLYELSAPIEGFGYQKDPRVAELRAKRNVIEDMPVLFECDKSQIASNLSAINETTKAYVGPLQPGIFKSIPQFNIEHVYTSFPEGRIRKQTLEIGGMSKEDLIRALRDKEFNTSKYAQSMVDNDKFTVLETKEDQAFISLTVKDLGFTGYTELKDIYQKAKTLGLDLCPSETGPQFRLQYQNHPLGEWIYIGMDAIPDSGGYPSLFFVGHNEDGLWLSDRDGGPVSWFDPDNRFLFRLPQLFLFFLRLEAEFYLWVQRFYPAAQHSADFIELFRKSDIFFIFQ